MDHLIINGLIHTVGKHFLITRNTVSWNSCIIQYPKGRVVGFKNIFISNVSLQHMSLVRTVTHCQILIKHFFLVQLWDSIQLQMPGNYKGVTGFHEICLLIEGNNVELSFKPFNNYLVVSNNSLFEKLPMTASWSQITVDLASISAITSHVVEAKFYTTTNHCVHLSSWSFRSVYLKINSTKLTNLCFQF